MSGVAMLQGTAREHFTRAADVVAVLVAVAIPWSTSAVGILAAIYVVAVLPTLTAADIRSVRSTAAMWLPLALVGLGLLGMLWADVTWAERFGGLKPTVKLLVLVLLMLHFRRSERTHWVIAAFLVSCTVLLAASMVPLAVPQLRWMWGSDYGVPVKEYITQSGEFLICIFSALYLAADCWKAGRRRAALGLLILALLFAADIVYVNTGRTALVTLPVLLLLFGMRIYGWKGVAAAVAVGIVAGAVVWASSPYLRHRTTALVGEVQLYEKDNTRTSAGERLEFWKKSLRFMADAPVFGNGTGSIASLYRKVVTGAETNRASSLVTHNPHNQTLMVGVQIGIVGIAVLWAMWIAHVLLFRGAGFVAWFGLLVTVQNIVGSLFNSHLSDFTQGWIYVLFVGAAGGAALRAAQQPGRAPG